ncbi:Regulator of G-protein signaling 3 [Strongyloides ratti]|uniref:Regulator of G-protein signaling 3 n=1 Tax=Strongyloides ratti TaxID=34506 RepID=A0A090L8E7_STRRB|nr:Regulator of G-protein signaling 3 [Strongyloides ratti]CEF63735.1 Regulator of G-protein signaling 3 [Strongyloides ratti]
MIQLVSFRMLTTSSPAEKTRDLSSEDLNTLPVTLYNSYELWNKENELDSSDDSEDDTVSDGYPLSGNPLLDSISDFTTSDSELYKSSNYVEVDWKKAISKKRRTHYSSTPKTKLRKVPSFTSMPNSYNSSSFENYEEELDDDSFTEYDHRNSKSLHRCKLSVIKELNSPSPFTNSTELSEYNLNFVSSSHLDNKWNPMQTSTKTELNYDCDTLPKNKPRTKMGTKRIPFGSYNEIHDFNTQCSPIRNMSSLDRCRLVKQNIFKSEQFGLPTQCARQWGCKGILYLKISLVGDIITFTVNKAIYFANPVLDNTSSYVKLELKQRDLLKSSDSYRHSKEFYLHHDNHHFNQKNISYRTKTIPNTNKPEFKETFSFKITLSNIKKHDRIGISVYSTSPNNELKKGKIGCMTFPIKRLIKKAHQQNDYTFGRPSNATYIINDGGFFLLGSTHGDKTNFPINKIKLRKFYDDFGTSVDSSSIGTSSIHSHSPLKMTNKSEWRYGQERHQMNIPNYSQPTNSIINYKSSLDDVGRSTSKNNNLHKEMDDEGKFIHPSNYSTHKQLGNVKSLGLVKETDLNCDNNRYKRHYRFTLPSITATTDSNCDLTQNTDFIDSAPMPPIGLHIFYADSATPNFNYDIRNSVREIDNNKQKPLSSSSSSSSSSLNNTNSVRRVSSFTFLPNNRKGKRNSTDSNGKDGEPLTHHDSKKNLNIVSKSINYVKHKMASALSFPILYPSRSEVRQWETSFEALLHHKDGSELFKNFLKEEFSVENLDFWFECEEFKKMKEGKKSYNKALHIYDLYIHEDGSKQVNLDADTRNITKTLLDNGSKSDTFNLAQSRIEQLMAKDSYPRFLRSKRYLDFVQEVEHSESIHTAKRNSTGDIN